VGRDVEKKGCKDCKYFSPVSAHRGICYSDHFVSRGDFYRKKIENNDLSYMDCGGHQAGFDVGKNFGCIHFVIKE